MVERSIGWAAEAMAGRIVSGAAHAAEANEPSEAATARWRRAAIDTRRIEGGELFFALPGERVDGHDYVGAARDRGAAGVVVHRDVEMDVEMDGPSGSSTCVVRVADTFEALHALTRAVRRSVPERLVGITGSAGKTTTKELVAEVLSVRFRVAKSPGNFNNLYGFPISLLAIADDSEWMVAEMGMSTPGELRGVSLLGAPDVAIFTNVRPVHLVNFDDVRGIAEAKAELLAGLAADGVVIANAGDPEVLRIARRHVAAHPGCTLVTYASKAALASTGFSAADVDYLADDLRAFSELKDPFLVDRPGTRFRLSERSAPAESTEMDLPVHGLYNVENALAAIACGRHLGIELGEVAGALAGFRPAAMRGEVHRLASGLLLVDDSYNSNPDAATRALDSAKRLRGRRHVAILGDMLELGPRELEFHAQVGREAARLGFDALLAVGPMSRAMADGAREASESIAVLHFDDAAQCARWLRAHEPLADRVLGDGDVVLVKASRGTGLDVAVAALRTENEAENKEGAG